MTFIRTSNFTLLTGTQRCAIEHQRAYKRVSLSSYTREARVPPPLCDVRTARCVPLLCTLFVLFNLIPFKFSTQPPAAPPAEVYYTPLTRIPPSPPSSLEPRVPKHLVDAVVDPPKVFIGLRDERVGAEVGELNEDATVAAADLQGAVQVPRIVPPAHNLPLERTLQRVLVIFIIPAAAIRRRAFVLAVLQRTEDVLLPIRGQSAEFWAAQGEIYR